MNLGVRASSAAWLAVGLCLAPVACAVRAESIFVPNGSFESPVTPFVNINLDAWQKTPKPDWYDETGPFLWAQLTGLFKNTDPGASDHIPNCDGAQAAWLFAVREVGWFQDYDSVDWRGGPPLHAFDARFEVGKSYRLTVGVMGAGGNMLPGASLQAALYYRDAATNQVVVAATNIVYSLDLFPDRERLRDFTVVVPPVRADQPWANQHVGLLFRSTVTDPNLEGGFWVLDHVRLTAAPAPALISPRWTASGLQFTLVSEPGLGFEILASTNAGAPAADWTSLGTVTNVSGATAVLASADSLTQRYYRARQVSGP
ncbi:MAG TPA: hypothetical protein VI136_12550 [Verrucomicrobiae bacterium]